MILFSRIPYEIANRLISSTMPNGVTSMFEYDGMSRLTRLKHQSSTATLFDNQYSYNTANQVGQIAELSQTKNFTYDNVDRLTGMTNGPSSETYAFDAVGNRTASHRSATYGYQPFNRLVSTASATYQSDANGNMIQKSEGSNFWRYIWDNENRLTQASTRKQKVRYKYDALGRRVERNVGLKERTKFVNDGQDVLLDDNAGTLTKYLNGPGIDNKLRAQTGSSINYFLADHLGSTNGLVDSTGALMASTSYDSFGNATTANFPSRYQFTGREFDSFSGLQFSRTRFYDPKLGRFISEDPIGFGGGDVNLYGYVWNSPGSLTDPMGLDGWGNDWADYFDQKIDYARQYWQPKEEGNPDWVANGVNNSVADVAHGAADLLRCGSGLGQAIYSLDENAYGRAAFGAMDVARCSALFATLAGPFSGGFGNTAESCPLQSGTTQIETPTATGLGRAPKQSTPNSIREQLDAGGNLRSRTFYDENGFPFNRQDFDHSHGGLQPHEHTMGFDANGRPNVKKSVGPLPPGY